MPENESQTKDFDWRMTTFEGSRREQLRRWAQLPLENIVQAIEEMQDISQQLAVAPPSPQGTHHESERSAGVGESTTEYGKLGENHEIVLKGCTPEPLMNYLKALGVLRLVSEQVDPGTRGFWRNDEFMLKSCLDFKSMLEFFMTRYEPTPIFSPWNGDGGFLTEGGSAYDAIEKIRSLKTGRLARMHSFIDDLHDVTSLKQLGAARAKAKKMQSQCNEKYGTKADKWKKKATEQEKEIYTALTKQIKSIKQSLIFLLRNEYPSESLPWLDACLAINQSEIAMSPILGSGGVDGRMEFSANYLANVIEILGHENSREWLEKSLFNAGLPVLAKTSIGQFAPGSVGGANATQGMEGDSLVNPWDYVLMLEGVVLLAGSVSRKLGVNQGPRAVFPFTVYSQAAGEASLAQKESRESRGEIWLPLWRRPAAVGEVRQIYSEGRAELCAKQGYSAVDFARAVADLGVDRGIVGFSRQGFLKRNGLAFIATPLGRFDVRVRENANLLQDIDTWLDRFRSACKVGQKGEAPARLTSALRRIDSAIFDYCRYGGRLYFQAILIALGRAERELMRDGRWAEKNRVQPLAGLSAAWVEASRDASPEYELALALADIHAGDKVGPLRANLEPVRYGCRKDGAAFASWAEKDRAVVWNQADLSGNLAAVLTRRMQDAARQGSSRLPLWSSRSASLSSVAAFLAGQTDDDRLQDLLWGLLLIDTSKSESGKRAKAVKIGGASPLPRLYALLKLLFLPASFVYQAGHWHYARSGESGITVRPEPRILPLLQAGRVDDAMRIAARRLNVSGLQAMITRAEQGGADQQSQRLAAALLFPIDSSSLGRLLHMVVREDSSATRMQGEPV